MSLSRMINRYWRGFVLWREKEKLTTQRERLDEHVQKRKAEAAKLGITAMLLDVYKNGHGYQPVLTNYQYDPPKDSLTFSIKGRTYTVRLKKFRVPFSDTAAETVTICLQEGDKELFMYSFEELR
jgi:hypothetical protein